MKTAVLHAFRKAGRIPSRIRSKIGMARRFRCYSAKRTRPACFPDRLYIENTNICNLECIMCPTGTGAMSRAKGVMGFGMFKSIIDEMAPRVNTVVLHIWGEPLLDERLSDKIRYAKKYRVSAELSTNATLLDGEKTDMLLKSGLDVIYLCLDGASRETYGRLRRGAGYEKTMANIAHFIAEKKRMAAGGPHVKLQIIDTKVTHDDIDEFRIKWLKEGADSINVKPLDTWGGQIREVSDLRVSGAGAMGRRYHCPNLWYHAHIYWDGTLVCCDRDFNAANPLGNVKDGVMRAWNGPAIMELRRRHIAADLAGVRPCGECMEWAWWRPTLFSSSGNIPQKRV